MAKKTKTAKEIDHSLWVERFSISEERVDHARKAFEVAEVTVANARAYGTPAHVAEAINALMERANLYADALKFHAHCVVELAKRN